MYHSDTYDISGADLRTITRINKTSVGGYLQDELSVFSDLTLVGGYRYETARYALNYHDNNNIDPDQDKKVKPNMELYNVGLIYTYREGSELFANIGKTFRFPEIDEFTYYDTSRKKQLNTNLKPQSSINYQVGLRHKFSDKVQGSFSLYMMKVKDELYLNSTGGASGDGQNENYDKTIHKGVESSINAKLVDWAVLFGNYAFTDAYFKGGEYDKNEIPLAARHKGSVGVRFFLPKNITFNMVGNYVGKRYFLNDQPNSQSRLSGYIVADTNISWHYKDMAVTLSINNLFNKGYAEYAGYSFSATDKFYYPNPKRNFNLKVNYSF